MSLDLPIEADLEDPTEHVTVQQVTFENESVDEVLPQVESAISEDLAPEPASPLLNEMVEPTAQAADEPSSRAGRNMPPYR